MIKQVLRRENKIKWPLHSVQQPISYGNLGCIHMVFRIVVIASKKKKIDLLLDPCSGLDFAQTWPT